MKHVFYLLIAFFLLAACNHSNKEIKQRISDADSMAINYFKGDGSTDTVVAVKITGEKKKIAQMADFISEASVEGDYKCGYDGSIHFFKMNAVVQDINFRMNEAGCMYFFFLLDGRPQATALSGKAKELISSLRK